MKELAEINAKGTPPGIVLLDATGLDKWVFLISVLGDETIYAVSCSSGLAVAAVGGGMDGCEQGHPAHAQG